MDCAGDTDPQIAQVKNGEGENKEEERPEGNSEVANTVPTASQISSEMMKNPQVLAALQHRLFDSIIGSPSDYIESLPKSIKRRIHALKNIQVETTKIEAKFFEEVHELERKYCLLYQPLFEKRRTIVTGSYEPVDEECEWESEEEEDEDGDDDKKGEKQEKEKIESVIPEDAKGIPEFWLTIFKSVATFQDMVQEHDEPILANLEDIRIAFSNPDEPMGFTIEFVFDTNEYFTNKVLTKHYKLQPEPDEKDPFSFEGPEIMSCEGCKIDWAKGKNVTVKTIKKKQKHKGRGTVRTVTKQVVNDSFFNFFNPPEVPDDDTELDPDTEALLETDYQIGHMIRDRIVPRAVLYFTGEAVDDDFEEEEEDEDEEGFAGETGEDSDSANDSDYDPAKDPKAKDTPQECKQQ